MYLYKATCSTCGTDADVFPGDGHWYGKRLQYQLTEQQVFPVLTRPVFCRACKAFQRAEHIPSDSEIEAWLKQAKQRTEQTNIEPEVLSDDLGFLWKVERSVGAWRDWASRIRKPGPGRCLGCGAEQVVPINWKETVRERPIPGITHEGCGGVFVLHEEGHVMMQAPPRPYPIEWFTADGFSALTLKNRVTPPRAAAPAPAARIDPVIPERQRTPEIETFLHRNPFYLLGVSPRDNRAHLKEVAEEKALAHDSDLYTKAGSDLATPRTRLAAEIGWFPGIAPSRAAELVTGLPTLFLPGHPLPSLTPLPFANVLAGAIELLDPSQDTTAWASWILLCGQVADSVAPGQVRRAINEDRALAGFPELDNDADVETELRNLFDCYRAITRSALNRLPPDRIAEVMTTIAQQSTENGRHHATTLVEAVVDSYESEVLGFLNAEADNVRRLAKAILDAAPKGAAPVDALLTRLNSVVSNWRRVARPIQVLMQSRGLEHPLSEQLCQELRELGGALYAKHDLVQQPKRIVELILANFSDHPETAERVRKDLDAITERVHEHNIQELISPIKGLCKAAREKAGKKPKAAADEARTLLLQSTKIFQEISSRGVPIQMLEGAKNEAAAAVSSCAIEYGNATSDWRPCVALLVSALDLATDPELITHIAKNISTTEKNLKLYRNLTPVKSAPSLFTLNGMGMKLYGASDPDAESGSSIATYYFVFLFVPLFPVARYLVIRDGDRYRFLAKAPFRNLDKWHIAIAVALAIWFVIDSVWL